MHTWHQTQLSVIPGDDDLRPDRPDDCDPTASSEYDEEEEEAKFINRNKSTSKPEQARQQLIDGDKPDLTLSHLVRVYETLPSNNGSQMSIFQTAPNSPIPPKEEKMDRRPFWGAKAPSPPTHSAEGKVGGWMVLNPSAVANVCTPISII
ncbi:MAG: hypothetical protein Q9160_001246 [Pyrenula sp. 1 TL-2023]